MRRSVLLVLVVLLAHPVLGGAPTSPSPVRGPVPVDVFYETGCDECAEIRRDVFPAMESRYAGYLLIREWDIGVTSNYLRLVVFQDKLGVRDNEPVSMVVDGCEYLAGVSHIRAGLFPALERALARRVVGEGIPVVPVIGPAEPARLVARVAGFTLAGIVGAAVVDSINPCAISTLVFFMSLLSVARIGPRRMALAGLAFLAASFVTYLAIGFGLLRLLRFLTAMREIRLVVEAVLTVLMAGLAFLSFRDALRYRRSGRPGDVSVKLPAWMQARIHGVMRAGMRKRSLVLGGMGMGAAVTVLESVCTGQVYVPALVMMVKSGQSPGWCILYLMLYNAIFVLPLGVALGLTCGGMSTPALVEWSRRNVVVSKTLMGLFFVGMTTLMVILK